MGYNGGKSAMSKMPIDGESLSKLEQLCHSSIEAGIAKLCEVEAWPRPHAARSLRSGYDFYYRDLEEIEEVNNLLQHLASDNKIKSIYSSEFSTPEIHVLYEYWEQLLLKILRETEEKTPTTRVFKKWFRKFLKELYSDTAIWRVVDTMTGLTLKGAKLKLDDATVLTSIPAHQWLDIIWREQQYDASLDWSGIGLDKATIITTVKIPKQQYASLLWPPPNLIRNIERHLAAIDAIRLTKPGTPSLHCFAEFQRSYFPVRTPLAHCNREHYSGLHEKETVLERSDFQNIRNLWRELMDTRYKDPRPMRYSSSILNIALGRFSMSYELQSWLENMVDLTIALEALFGPEDNQELSHRIALRCAWLLNIDEDVTNNRTYKKVRTMYDIRSSVVHGKKPKKNKIRKWIQTLSEVTYDETKSHAEQVEVALESARDIVRETIRACMKLSKLGTSGPHFPFPSKFDEHIITAGQQRIWQKAAGIKKQR